MTASFLFYDLETFGADPRRTRIAQFAAIRTNEALEEMEDPISFFVQPADDLLPSPQATLVTGIAPQDALRDGVAEAAAFARINDEMARPGTCSAGYNSLRFDDEFVRHGLFRNFFDAYEREWRGGNSRWDLLDVLRLAHALRPDGLVWPRRRFAKRPGVVTVAVLPPIPVETRRAALLPALETAIETATDCLLSGRSCG